MSEETKSPRGGVKAYTPVLGLMADEAPVVAVASAVVEQEVAGGLQLSVIVPARNEAENLPGCLRSLLEQDGELFRLGRDWELIVVDDESTDGTLGIAEAVVREGVRVLRAPKLELRATQRAFTGKTQACWLGAQASGIDGIKARWLLFTDADTVHEPGDLVRAMHEAVKHHAGLLSYSPRQVVRGFWQRALMPLIFSELASVYPMAQVNDPAQRVAAANGQFLMVDREIYFNVGGHRTVGRSVLEDVDLAYNVKRAGPRHGGRAVWFRYAPDALSTRMYRGVGDMIEGWTKNLALLFPHALGLAAWRLLDILLLLLPVLLYVFPHWVSWKQVAIVLLWVRNLWRFYGRVARSNFGFVDCAISVFALPLFIGLLVRSWMDHKVFHRVGWKGRVY